MASQNKEYIYFFLDYIVVLVFGPEKVVYLFFFTFLIYIFLLQSTIIFAKCLNLNSSYLILCVLIVAFSPVIFSMSAHLVRQILAVAVSCYIIASSFSSGCRKKLVWLTIPIFIHSSIFIFGAGLLGVYLLMQLSNFKRNLHFYLIVITIGVVVFLGVRNMEELPYLFSRISDLDVESFDERFGIKEVMIGATPIFCLFLLQFIPISNDSRMFLVRFFLAGIFLWAAALFVNFRLDNFAQIGTRLIIVDYIYFPIVISFIVTLLASRVKYTKVLVTYFLPYILVLYFFIQLESSPWVYHFNYWSLLLPFPVMLLNL
jgi:hypothetical protein